MKRKILKALKGSIKKWEKIISGKGIDGGGKNCPLCQITPLTSCEGCPVAEKVRRNHCIETPYDDWTYHQAIRHPKEHELKVLCKTCKRLAKKELRFLKSLLPSKEKEKRKEVIE